MRTGLFMGLMLLAATSSLFANSSIAGTKADASFDGTDKKPCCALELNESKGNKVEGSYSCLLPFGYSNRLITIQVGLASAEDKHEFILDSGAPTFITDSVAQTHDLSLMNTTTAYDVNRNEQQVDEYSMKKITLGGREIKNVKAISSPMVDHMPLLKNHPYAGLLGANSMKNNIWTINYHSREIIISGNLDTLAVPEEAFTTEMKTDELNRPMVAVTLGDKQTVHFIIDVAYNGSLLLPKRFMSRPLFNDSLTYTKYERLSSGFVSEVSSMEYKFVKELTIGDMKLENVKASTSGNNTDALIGNEFLENYIVVLDFIHERVTFLPAGKSCESLCC